MMKRLAYTGMLTSITNRGFFKVSSLNLKSNPAALQLEKLLSEHLPLKQVENAKLLLTIALIDADNESNKKSRDVPIKTQRTKDLLFSLIRLEKFSTALELVKQTQSLKNDDNILLTLSFNCCEEARLRMWVKLLPDHTKSDDEETIKTKKELYALLESLGKPEAQRSEKGSDANFHFY